MRSWPGQLDSVLPPVPLREVAREPELLSLFIGFTPGAKELFKQENHLALYRLPSAETLKETSLGRPSCVTKRRPPLSHMISLFIKDTATSKPHFSLSVDKPSQGCGVQETTYPCTQGREAKSAEC